MRAAIYHTHGGSDVLQVLDVPTPEPATGQVLVEVAACSLNHLDLLQRRGPALIPGYSLPHIAGMDVAGTVVAVGPDTAGGPEGIVVGDRVVVNPAIGCGACSSCLLGADGKCEVAVVIGGNQAGGYAEHVAVPITNVHRIPADVSFADAAVVPTVWMTAWHALLEVGGLRLGETVLIHAGASGVSTAAIQLAKATGARVIATGSTEAKLDYARGLGADVLVNSASDDITKAVREATEGRGVQVVLDHVGPAVWDASIYSLAPRGRMVFVGNTTGNRAEFDLVYAYHFGLRLLGSDPYDRHEFPTMLAAYWASDFVTPIDKEFALADARAAHDHLESRRAAGKVLLVP